MDHSMEVIRLFKYAKLLLILAAFAISVFGQCSDSSTQHLAVHHIIREASNSVDTLSGTQTIGDYWYTWDSYVSATLTVSGNTLHTGSNYGGVGNIASVEWHDAPSASGSGTYATSNYHVATSTCNDHSSYYSSDSHVVNKPTITSSLFAFWNLGPGSADPTTSSMYSGDSYVQHADLSINTQCSGTDVCTGTPQWSTSSNVQATLSSPSGNSTVLNHTSARGNCSYDTQVTVSIDGFSSDPVAFAVNSPLFLVHNGSLDHTDPNATGYLTYWQYSIADACSPANAIKSLPIYEVFSGFSNPGVISGWGDPMPSNAADFLTSLYIFTDGIGNSNRTGTSNPAPTWTSSTSPFTYYTVIKYGGQTWYAGVTNGGGWSVGSGTLTFYQDHADGAVH